MPNLQLSQTELDNLFVLLSVHSTQSDFDTFGVYVKVKDHVTGAGLAASNRTWEARQTLRVLDNGLIEFKRAEPEPVDTTNPFKTLLLEALDLEGNDYEVWHQGDNSFKIHVDDKVAVVTVSEPEVSDNDSVDNYW